MTHSWHQTFIYSFVSFSGLVFQAAENKKIPMDEEHLECVLVR